MSDVITELAKEASDKAMEIARLKAENTELRESVRRLMTQRDERLARAEAENAKLRELLLDVHALGCSGFDCTECPIAFAERCNDEYSGCEWVSILTDRMRELGVEVGDG